MTVDPRHALEQAGRAAAPEPDDAFAARLEQRLRAVASTVDGAAASPTVDGLARRARRWWAAGAAGLAALAFAAVLAVNAEPTDPRDLDVELTSATDAVVTFEDGRTVAAVSGQEIPEGAIVRTGPAGRVIAGGTTLAPNEEAVVDDGELRRRRARMTASTPTDRPEPRPSTTTTTGRAPSAPPPTRPATSTTTARPATTTTTGSRPTTTTIPPRQQPVELGLRAARTDGRGVALAWTAYSGEGFARYVIVRADGVAEPAPEPVYPPGDRMTVVASISDPSVTRFVDQVPDGVRDVRYRVVALDAEDHVIGRSAAVRPG